MKRIKQRSDGRYCIQIYTGTVDGKKKYKSVYGYSVSEVNKKADDVRKTLLKGLVPTDDTFTVWADYYLTVKEMELSENQYKLVKSRINYWKDKIGNIEVSKLRLIDIQTAFNDLAKCNPATNQPTAKRTLQYYKQNIASVLDFCVDNRIIDYNPSLKLKSPQNAPQSTRRALTPTEQQWINEFEHRAKPAAILMMYSGLRRGEASALLWSDVDFKNNTISVTKSYDFKLCKLKPPKNGKSRLVSVPQKLIDYLKTLPQKSEYVITTAKGERMTETAWKRLLESYIYDLNYEYGYVPKSFKKYSPNKIPLSIEPFSWHCLRHTFCTLMYNAGVDVLTAKEQMGHSDVKTTLAIYTHLQNEHKAANISKLDEFLVNRQVKNA